MEKHTIFDTYFSTLVKDYLSGAEPLKPFYAYAPDLQGYGQAAQNRRFAAEQRKLLVQVLTEQHKPFGKIQAAVRDNIAALEDSKTFTVTTGHQICLMTGPLYFIFKIASAVKLAQRLQAAYPEYRFVPVYWAATEDHDFEEIQSVFLNGKKYTWTPPQPVSGGTGRIPTRGLADFFQELEDAEGEKLMYNRVYQTFKKAWTEQPDLSAAVRKAVYDLFGHLGVVSIDADDKRLKATCTAWITRELKERFSFKAVKENTKALQQAGYKTQIEPREINLFYLADGLRERIIKDGGTWAVNNTDIRFKENALDNEVQAHPERFSPNVVLRPLYQECVLPNIAYIGGPAEIAYWLQLKKAFDTVHVDFPVLVPRDGFLFTTQKDLECFLSLGFHTDDMLRSADFNLGSYIKRTDGKTLSVKQEKESLKNIFALLKKRYTQADNGAEASFAATEKRLEKELAKLEKKALKFAGRKSRETSAFLHSVRESWFPGGTLAERRNSIIEYWGTLGAQPAEALVEHADPLTPGLKLIVY